MVFNVKMDNLFNNQYNELTKGGNEDLNIYTFSPINSYDVVKEGGEDGGGPFGKKSKKKVKEQDFLENYLEILENLRWRKQLW